MKHVLLFLTLLSPLTSLAQWSGTSTVQYFTGGRVGIGTSTPQHGLLEINGSGATNGITFWTNAGEATSRIWTDPTSNLFHLTRGDLPSKGLTLTADGKLGLGTTASPSSKLHVFNLSSGGSPHQFTDFLVEDADRGMIQVLTGASGVGYFGFADADDDYVGGIQYEHATDRMFFRVNNHDFSDLTVAAQGYVGIGTDNPQQKLEVYDGRARINSAAPILELYERDNEKIWFLVGDGNRVGFRQNTTSSSNEVLSLGANGNVGVGVTDPTMKLDVNGDLRVRGDLSNIYFRRTTSATDIAKLQYDDAASQFVVGANNKSIVFQNKLNFGETLRIAPSGNVGIGTASPDSKLTVKGTIHAEEVRVDLSVPGPDYVFEKDYRLPSLDEVAKYIDEHKHLPDVPSAKEMEENGVELGEMNMIMLRKIEELTLYLMDQDARIKRLEEENARLRNEKKN